MPGQTTQVAAKNALAHANRAFGWWIASCVSLVVLALGLVYLLNRVRTEGPEVVLGKTSSANPSSWSEKVSLPSGGQPNLKQSQETPTQKPPSSAEHPSDVQRIGSSLHPQKPAEQGDKSSPPLRPGEKNGRLVLEKPSPKAQQPTSPPAPPSALQPAKQAAWQKAVQEVRAALAEHDLASAAEALKTAEDNAQTPEQHHIVERLRLLRHYLEEFWKGIRQSVSSLEAAQEFTVGQRRFAIVEGNSQYLIVRAEGRNIRWPIEKIPGSVVELLAKRWFRTNDAATQLAFGAYYAVRGDTQRARQYWEQAGQSGVDVSGMLEELHYWPVPEHPTPSNNSPLQ